MKFQHLNYDSSTRLCERTFLRQNDFGQLHQFCHPITSKLPGIIIQNCHKMTFTVATELY